MDKISQARRQLRYGYSKKWLIRDLSDSGGEHYGDFLELDCTPDFIKEIISKTVDFNCEKVDISKDESALWKDGGELNEYQNNLQYFHVKSDRLSYGNSQKKYNLFILLLAIIGTVVACAFLIYDDAALSFMIFPCTVAIAIIFVIVGIGRKNGYHKKYIEYRALILDPTRRGCDGEVLQATEGFERIVYISCNPQTLAKDLKILCDKYDVICAQPFYIFPQTANVDTLVVIKRIAES